MQTSNELIKELLKFELSDENKSYNGITIYQSDEGYFYYLDKIYNDYIWDLNSDIDKMLIDDNSNLLKFIQSKINAFEQVKSDLSMKSIPFDDLINHYEMDINGGNKSSSLFNEYKLVKFYRSMYNVQQSFINKVIEQLITTVMLIVKRRI